MPCLSCYLAGGGPSDPQERMLISSLAWAPAPHTGTEGRRLGDTSRSPDAPHSAWCAGNVQPGGHLGVRPYPHCVNEDSHALHIHQYTRVWMRDAHGLVTSSEQSPAILPSLRSW